MIAASSRKQNGESALISYLLFTKQRNDTNYSYSSYEDLVAQLNQYFTLKGLAPSWKNVRPFANVLSKQVSPFTQTIHRESHSYSRADLCNSLCIYARSWWTQSWKIYLYIFIKMFWIDKVRCFYLIWYQNIFEKDELSIAKVETLIRSFNTRL